MRRVRTRHALAALAAAAVLAGTPTARAEDRALARTLFEEAASAREQGRWADARGLLERALAAYAQFSIAWNLVTAIERTGDLPEAERVLAWMRDGGVPLSASERTSVVDRLDELAPRLATLLVVAPDARGALELDASRRVELDASGFARVRVSPGAHELAIEIGDGRRVERSIEVRAGGSLRVRLPPESPIAPAALAADADVVARDAPTVWSSPWLWVAVGAAALVAGGVAIALTVDGGTAPPRDADFVARGF